MNSDFIADTVFEWSQGLDYEYMVLHIIVCYGLYYSDNLRWIVEYFSPVRRKGISKAVWVVGGILAVIEMARFFPFIGDGGLDHQKFISILHSYIVVQVFVEPIVSTINKWMKVFNKTANNITSSGRS